MKFKLCERDIREASGLKLGDVYVLLSGLGGLYFVAQDRAGYLQSVSLENNQILSMPPSSSLVRLVKGAFVEDEV